MASQTVTLELEGAPTIEDYAVALSALRELLASLSVEVATGVEITWVVDSLDAGSALTAFRGEAEDVGAVSRVATAYLNAGASAVRGELTALPNNVRRAVRTLTGVINVRVPAIRFETADDDVTITSRPSGISAPSPTGDIPGAYGAVEGRIQTLLSRNALRFTLYDMIHDRPVSCYLQPDQQELVRDLWDRLAVVEGWIRRDPFTGRPTAVRRIRRISPIEPVAENAWRAARGVLTSPDSSEAIIRRIRDAE